mgnify:FL=1
MDRINEIKKRSSRPVPGSPPSPVSGGSSLNPTTVNELAARLKALKGKSSDDVEFL